MNFILDVFYMSFRGSNNIAQTGRRSRNGWKKSLPHCPKQNPKTAETRVTKFHRMNTTIDLVGGQSRSLLSILSVRLPVHLLSQCCVL
jgi:hypothetical protein